MPLSLRAFCRRVGKGDFKQIFSLNTKFANEKRIQVLRLYSKM